MKIASVLNNYQIVNKNVQSVQNVSFESGKHFKKTDEKIVRLIEQYLTYDINKMQFDSEFSLNINKAKDRREKLPTWLESLKEVYKKVNDIKSIEDDEYISTGEFDEILYSLMNQLQEDGRYKKVIKSVYR